MGIAEDRRLKFNELGYEVRYFAHRHQLTLATAAMLVERIGPDRIRLDEAARALKSGGT